MLPLGFVCHEGRLKFVTRPHASRTESFADKSHADPTRLCDPPRTIPRR